MAFYGFNPLTVLDLPLNELSNLDGVPKAELVKSLHEKARANIEKSNKQYADKANKGRKKLVLMPDDWVWVHFRKERFPNQRKNKLDARGAGPFQVLERINDNAYKIDLPGEYGVSTTFNISDLSPFDMDVDLRTNIFKEQGDDTDPPSQNTYRAQGNKDHNNGNPLVLPSGPITRSRAKKYGAVDQVQGAVQRNMEQPCPYTFKNKLHKSSMTLLPTSAMKNLKEHLSFSH
ncbi:uncharacterized protein LOC119369086 [Jatropha curcas]|uniref:uncharacterized protein LOC119369086 n=1 Tax=Jatropha curcas TaxID=180498 RepID=UPI001893BC81|nr:uncharacterized protein LOC119369086 [Jatropha curcas]